MPLRSNMEILPRPLAQQPGRDNEPHTPVKGTPTKPPVPRSQPASTPRSKSKNTTPGSSARKKPGVTIAADARVTYADYQRGRASITAPELVPVPPFCRPVARQLPNELLLATLMPMDTDAVKLQTMAEWFAACRPGADHVPQGRDTEPPPH